MTSSSPEQRLKSALWTSLAIVIVVGIAVLAILLFVNREKSDEFISDLENAAPVLIDSDVDPPVAQFEDITAQAGIEFVHVNGAAGERLLPETMGGGVAFLDFDNDGDQDLILVNSRNWDWSEATDSDSSSALFANLGDGTFVRLTDAAIEEPLYGMGVAVGDYNGDGYIDVFITAVGSNRLLRNVDGERFEDVTDSMGVAGGRGAWSTCATFFDYDNDEDLDLFVCNYVEWTRDRDIEVDYRLAGIGRAYGPPTDFGGTNSYLYRNDGNQFTDVSKEAGIEVFNEATDQPVGKALAVVAVDINEDTTPDLVVANDTVRNFAFLNQADGSFVESGMDLGIAFDNSGAATGAMGIDSAHVWNDDEQALAIGNFANEMSSFYVRRSNQTVFSDDSIISGIGAASRRALTFGLVFLDYDLDGRLDIFAANGHVEPEINRVQSSQQYAQASQIWWNCGEDCQRDFVLVDSNGQDWGRPIIGRGAAYADIDGDSDLDLIVTQVGDRPLLLRNATTQGKNFVRLQVRQDSPNTNAIGARVTVRGSDKTQTRIVTPTRSYLSQVELPLTFGLEENATTVSISIRWPNGELSEWDRLRVSVSYLVERRDSSIDLSVLP
ncbi:MAG: CRTAC1 family protein [Gammaproteobacteria bacterium]|nr:CRTAC1 family protein [Gammaproteobacteria bacterium]